ncbi:O-antigen ligase family protein [Adhaeretor mobilis]|nr:O-antigen ligase family protein [Adhaeretor mobilis]
MSPGFQGCHALNLPLAILIVDLFFGANVIQGHKVLKVVVILSGIVLSLSKPAVAGAFLVVIAAFMASPASVQSSKSGQYLKFGGILLVLVTLFLFVIMNNESAMSHVQRAYLKEGTGGELSGGRMAMWEHSLLGVWKDNALFGHGMGHYVTMWVTDPITRKTIFIENLDHHNQVIKFIDQIGLVGCSLVAAILVAWYRKTIVLVRSLKGARQLAATSLFAFVLSVIGISFFGAGIRMSSIGFLFWMSLGLIPAISKRRPKSFQVRDRKEMAPKPLTHSFC